MGFGGQGLPYLVSIAVGEMFASANMALGMYHGLTHGAYSAIYSHGSDEQKKKYFGYDGLNLCFETREGVLKRCPRKIAPKFGAVADRFVFGGQPSLEAQISNIADEIAYNHHDLDDGLRSGLITIEEILGLKAAENA